ncbi:MAG: DUF362 domain-containing protein [Candidatus Bathyarchaeota archaeon]|nr:DUF362 domain-containing protein [Candidatus Bathyarchaeota archaeon]
MSTVYWEKTTNRRVFVQKFFAAEKVAEKVRGKTVLVKPNMVSYEAYPTTTHLETVQAVVEQLKKSADKVGVGDGKAFDCPVDILQYPIAKLCRNLNVDFVDLAKPKMKTIRTQSGFDLEVSSALWEFDCMVSLPVLKYNFSTGLTGALKNQYGFLSDHEKQFLHQNKNKDIHKAIAELSRVRKPDFYVVDAVQTMICAQEMRHGGKTAELGCMYAGADPVSLDAYGFELLVKVERKLKRILGKPKPEQIRHLKYAAEFGVGKIDYELKPI